MSTKFYICRRCGNLAELIISSGVNMMCCGQKMEELVPNTVEASGEKHLPVVSIADGTARVEVGSVAHPMAAEHFIEWICLETESGVQRKALKPGDKPVATFFVGNENVIAAYAYCNLHGLWKTTV